MATSAPGTDKIPILCTIGIQDTLFIASYTFLITEKFPNIIALTDTGILLGYILQISLPRSYSIPNT